MAEISGPYSTSTNAHSIHMELASSESSSGDPMVCFDGGYKVRRRLSNASVVISRVRINADNTNILILWSQIQRTSTFKISRRYRSLVTAQRISMPNPPHQWRAHCGYIPPPSYSAAGYQYSQHMSDPFGPAHHFAPLPNPPWARAPAPAPVPANAYSYAYPTEISTPVAISAPPSPQGSFWSVSSMTEDGRVPGLNPPSGLRDGVHYLYPANNTTIHVLDSSNLTWNNGSGCGLSNFLIYIVPCCVSVRELMVQLGGDGENMAVTELFETGRPDWDRGMTIRYNDEVMATKPLSMMGWTEQRGGDSPPVWMVLHRAP